MRHARNRARAARLSPEDLRQALAQCTTVEPSVSDRSNVFARLPDGRLLRATVQLEAGRLIVITVTIVGR